MLDELTELNIKRLQNEVAYLNYKINRFTILCIGSDFNTVEKGLVERYIGKMMDRKLTNQRLLDAYNMGEK